MTPGYFDSHCHLTDAAFRDDREAVLVRAAERGVRGVVTIASDLADARAALDLARERPAVWCTAGIHPHAAGEAGPGDLDAIAALARDEERVVALGETGLDYHYDNAPRTVQRELFARHLELGAELGLPVVVHSREADADVAAALDAMPGRTLGVLHCFTGGPLAFERALARGWYVSFSGIASFRTFGAADLLREVPRERLLIETDAPYLAPVPYRGRRNEPAFVVDVARAVAEHLGADAEDVGRLTAANARRFYGLEEGAAEEG